MYLQNTYVLLFSTKTNKRLKIAFFDAPAKSQKLRFQQNIFLQSKTQLQKAKNYIFRKNSLLTIL